MAEKYDCEEFKLYYANRLTSMNYGYQTLDTIATVSKYNEEKSTGDIYICYLGKKDEVFAPYITTDPNENCLFPGAIHYVVKTNDDLIFRYLQMVAYAFKSTDELVANAKIPTSEYIRSNVTNAYIAYESMLQSEILRNRVIDNLRA
jgi:hypothetical protein